MARERITMVTGDGWPIKARDRMFQSGALRVGARGPCESMAACGVPWGHWLRARARAPDRGM